MRGPASLVTLVMIGMLMSGCTGPDDTVLEPDEPVVVTSPDDYTYVGNATLDNGGHLHDYWGGQERLDIIDWTEEVGSTWFGPPIPVATFRPEHKVVIPQGTSEVQITISWQIESETGYSPPELWVRTAADSEPVYIQDLTSGETMTLETSNEQNDLPHQTLSAWILEFRSGQPQENNPQGLIPMTVDGSVTAYVEAVRGLPIPVYPAHPDHWEGRSEIEIFSLEGESTFYRGDPTNGQWSCFGGCPWLMSPGDGSIVPPDADRIEFVLTQDMVRPTTLSVAFHGGEGRDFQRPAPSEESGDTRTYVLILDEEATPDGPYALQSLWEFTPYPDSPEENGWVNQEYGLTVTVYNDD